MTHPRREDTSAQDPAARASTVPQIFVIEDETDVREALAIVMSSEGYAVSAWPNALEALAAIDAGATPDLIVLDLMMPKMDGWQFRVAQRQRPRVADVPVLVISADDSSKAAAIDADAFMRKPINIHRMCAVVARLLTAADRKRLSLQTLEGERLRSLGTLVAGVAHEINNPLTFVSGSLELADRSLRAMTSVEGAAPSALDVQRMRKALADARVGADRIASIVRTLSRFSRLEPTTTDAIDLHHVIDGACALAAGEFRGRAMLVRSYGDVPTIVGCGARLGQVFLNLLVNAAQAVPRDGISAGCVRVTTGTTASGTFVEVSDNGAGIPEELVDRIFEPFFTTKPVGEGTGLGLSVSQDIVAAHGGVLSVRSVLGHGTTFRIDLPTRVKTPPQSSIESDFVDHGTAESGERLRPSARPPRAYRVRS